MISSIEWVPAGVADPSPKKYEFSQAELDLIEMMEKHNMEDAKEIEPKKEKKKKKVVVENTLPADLRMDEYSSDEEDNEAMRGAAIGKLLVEGDDGVEGNEEEPQNDSVSMESDDNSDGDSDDDDLGDVPDTREYMPVDLDGLNSIGFSQVGTNAPNYMEDNDDDEGSDAEDVQLRSSDAIVVVAKTEEEFAALEVHVYEQDSGNLFVHHDIPLPAFPLCLSHGDIGPTGSAGNFCAVGTFGPGIEIWNLDVLNALEPLCVLGGEDTSMADEIMRLNMMNNSDKRHNNTLTPQGGSLKPGSHTDAVMALSWNKVHRQVIASGSADCTVKLWDITQARTDKANATTLNHHKDKVQSVLWHPTEGTLLATGSYDRTVALVDARSTENVKTVRIPGDCESLAWDPFNPQYLTAASEDGTVMCWDVRKFSTKTPLWSIVASEYGGISDLSYNPNVPGMMATSSVDKTVTLWDTMGNSPTHSPTAKMNKDMKVGKLFTLNFYPSSPWLMGCAGGSKEIAIWDMAQDDTIQKCFGDRIDHSLPTKNEDSNKREQIQPSFDSLINSNVEKQSDEKVKQKPSISNKNKKKKKKSAHSRASRCG
eukprot:CAMPEP_0172409378 /NCGR_PEP_ID=MMETSP1061-20121228/76332_1 /TAXON_ID=37318 /ORGANISM="Pseudo-nitzschia pungens, Strain cf. pungens" /LENGTH=594 /DNA_ID=CAMNT_0013145531 /DNA_START=48 /DNA_END=1832 /DNA_ORIENTATION=-